MSLSRYAFGLIRYKVLPPTFVKNKYESSCGVIISGSDDTIALISTYLEGYIVRTNRTQDISLYQQIAVIMPNLNDVQ